MHRIIAHTHDPFPASRSLAGRLRPRRRMTPVAHASYHAACPVQPVTEARGSIGVDVFRSVAWEPAVPVHLRGFHRLPAMETWFAGPGDAEEAPVSFGHKLASSADAVVSYELITSSPHSSYDALVCSTSRLHGFQTWLKNQPARGEENHLLCALIDHLLASAAEANRSRFLQFDAPLSLIIQASRYNQGTDYPPHRMKQLYIAQSDIRSLPPALAEDLPVPEIVKHAGKGDIYSSSIWLGLQPTYTPLHRDPNPNLFCQLAGSKHVRLMRPWVGQSVFRGIRRLLGAPGSSRLRGPEMMDGPELDGLHRAVWVDDRDNTASEIWEAVLDPGDALFIPQGWWHSVRSVGNEAELNASANWWFR